MVAPTFGILKVLGSFVKSIGGVNSSHQEKKKGIKHGRIAREKNESGIRVGRAEEWKNGFVLD